MDREIIDDFPIGLFKISQKDGEYIISYCNNHYAKLLGYLDKNEVIGKKPSDFHRNKQCTKNYYKELSENDFLKDYRLDSIDAKGNKRTFCIDCSEIKDKNGNVIGRSGVMHDLSELDTVKLELELLQTDIGQLLHSYSSTLLLLKQTLEAVFESHSIDITKKRLSNRIDQEENNHVVQIQITEVLHEFDEWEKKLTLHQRLIYKSVIFYFIEKLKEFKTFDGSMTKVVNLRAVTLHILKLFVRTYKIPLSKSLIEGLTNLLRHTSLYVLDHSIDSVTDMDTDVDSFREWVTSGVRKEKEYTFVSINELVHLAMESLSGFSKRREIKLVFIESKKNIKLRCIKSDVYRAIFSIMHNAIKYSWTVRSGNSTVRLKLYKENSKVIFEARNWGVKITEDELKEERLVKFGYRGIHSQDRNRPGTGIGLSDVNRVMKNHKGEIIIESKPTKNQHFLQKKESEIPNITSVKLVFNG